MKWKVTIVMTQDKKLFTNHDVIFDETLLLQISLMNMTLKWHYINMFENFDKFSVVWHGFWLVWMWLHLKNPKFHVITKHIELQHHFIKKNWRMEKCTSHIATLKECFVTFWLKGFQKLNMWNIEIELVCFLLWNKKKSMLKNSVTNMQAQVVVHGCKPKI
jgi:hypothetical protein